MISNIYLGKVKKKLKKFVLSLTPTPMADRVNILLWFEVTRITNYSALPLPIYSENDNLVKAYFGLVLFNESTLFPSHYIVFRGIIKQVNWRHSKTRGEVVASGILTASH